MAEWPRSPFSELLQGSVRNGIYKSKEFHGRGCKIVNMGELFAYPRLTDVPMKRVELNDTEKERFLLRSGDLLFARRSLTAEGAGKCSIVLEIGDPTTFESSIIRARPDPAIANSLFLYYFFSSPLGYRALDTIRRQVAVAGITGSDLAALSIPAPSLEIQNGIANVLSALDEKIELNRRMNVTLEAIAQAIFRDWFVNFGPVRRKIEGTTDPIAILGGLIPEHARADEVAALFPNSMGDNGLPLGWKKFQLMEIAGLTRGSINPLFQSAQQFEHFSLPAFDKGREAPLDFGATIKSNKTPVMEGDVLLSKLNPEIERVWLVGKSRGFPQVASTEFLAFKPIVGLSPSLLFCLFRDVTFRAELVGMVTGTSKSHQRIKPSELMTRPVIAGREDVFRSFGSLTDSLFSRLLAAQDENRTLAETRDYLLPRLMSGRVRTADAEGAVG